MLAFRYGLIKNHQTSLKMLSRLRSFSKSNYPAIVVCGIVIGGHIYWKWLQDIGVGDKGRDYPHKKMPEVYYKTITKKLFGEKNESADEEDGVK